MLLITTIQEFFSHITWEQVNFQRDDDEVRFVLVQQAEWDFYSASSPKQQFVGGLCRSTQTHYPDSESTSLCSCSLMLYT